MHIHKQKHTCVTRIPLRLKVSIVRVAGPITIWVAPPPSNRLWYSFTQPPELDIRAAPEVLWSCVLLMMTGC